MGCDIFFGGSLPEERLQEKVLRFVLSAFGKEIALYVRPIPGKQYLTYFYSRNPLVEYPYPFDYFGVIPFFEHRLFDHSQFVFDRTAGGKLIRFVKLPKEFNLLPDDEKYETEKSHVAVLDGGYTRQIGGEYPFCLLLNIIRLRWWPEMWIADDYGVYIEVSGILLDSGLSKIMKNDKFDFPKCWSMLEAVYRIRYPTMERSEETRPFLRAVAPNATQTQVKYLNLGSEPTEWLKQAGIETVEELMASSKADLLKRSDRDTVDCILKVLQKRGIDLSPKSVEQIPIKDLDLTVVTENCLIDARIWTVGGLIACSEADLLKQDMNRRSVNELVEVLQGLGLHFKAKQRQ
jgi:hypothetical protein